MDENTLKYLGEKVDNARALNTKIQNVKNTLANMREYKAYNIEVNFIDARNVSCFGGSTSREFEDALPSLQQALVERIEGYLADLEAEFEAL